ncbi:unnamed protein product [Calypogeia fissa]
MKLSKGGRFRQPGSSSPLDEVDHADETGRGLLTSFERLQPKKVAKDFYSKGQTDEHSQVVDGEEDKYDKTKTPKKIMVLLGLVCAIAVLTLAYPESHPVGGEEGDQPHQTTFVSASSRALHNVGPGCKKKGSSAMELKLPGLGNTVTYCDLPKGASLLGLLQLKRHGEGLKIGLVNIDEEEELNWHHFTLGWARYHVFPFEKAPKNLQWSDFYPEWIDESAPSSCPHLPVPLIEAPINLHAVIVKVPCGRRDVGRLQIMRAAATVASKTGGDGHGENMLVLVISECRPALNFFPCSELVEQQDDLWLFQVNLARLREQLALPVGSCDLALRIDNNSPQGLIISESHTNSDSRLELLRVRRRREVYATILHTDGAYVCGAIVAARSIRLTGSQRDLIALVDENITAEQREGLQLAGWKLHDIERIRNPKSEPRKYNAWNYSKFRLWQLTQYDKVIYIDADLLVLQNLDFLFDMPELSATGNDKSLFNSGVMVIEPSNCTFNLLMDQMNDIESYNGGDQGYLNEIFPSWHRISKRLNFLKHFWSNGTKERDEKTTLFGAVSPPSLHVIHYLGRKPWLCYRDYDCNWDSGHYRKYASDTAHSRWWEVHDAMPEKLQDQCLLLTKQKANLEFNRRRAEAAGFEDEHWNITITDPRQTVCPESFCNWKSMLKHWGEPNVSRRRLQF